MDGGISVSGAIRRFACFFVGCDSWGNVGVPKAYRDYETCGGGSLLCIGAMCN